MEADHLSLCRRPGKVMPSDPLEELCRRLRCLFSSVVNLKVSNVDRLSMDHRFLSLRCHELRDFPHVCLSAVPDVQLSGTGTGTHTLTASAKAQEHRHLDMRQILALNRARPRHPIDISKPKEFVDVDEAEALFLTEHTAVYKSALDIFSTDGEGWAAPGKLVRNRYSNLLKMDAL
eukprot:gnl/TRDRNA2_/TRDRNA2_201893_c0_seq1.p1 gnl/TRDRNA2_/TRDRNA2_201893_c0~~gnl/TRDRNA2_/TRDRNA2_201893_c0_seq1.p1  ORF type:complete len:176 (-),score=28.82 gnl/TRDRNA2_/TRDRNA2_201893_c0_seq1:144-671(-)